MRWEPQCRWCQKQGRSAQSAVVGHRVHLEQGAASLLREPCSVCSQTLTDDHEWQADKLSAADDLWQEIWKRDSVTGNGELNCSQKHWRVSPIIETDVPKKIGTLKFPLLLLNVPGKKRSSFQGILSQSSFSQWAKDTIDRSQPSPDLSLFLFLFFYIEFLGSRLTRLIIF